MAELHLAGWCLSGCTALLSDLLRGGTGLLDSALVTCSLQKKKDKHTQGGSQEQGLQTHSHTYTHTHKRRPKAQAFALCWTQTRHPVHSQSQVPEKNEA
jgi:hypothetical protein